MSKRMHDELPPPGMGRAVVFHRRSGSAAPDPVKALAFMRETRDALDWFIDDFEDKSNHALAYMRDPDHTLMGELMYVQYCATATANRLDLVIAALEREAEK